MRIVFKSGRDLTVNRKAAQQVNKLLMDGHKGWCELVDPDGNFIAALDLQSVSHIQDQ